MSLLRPPQGTATDILQQYWFWRLALLNIYTLQTEPNLALYPERDLPYLDRRGFNVPDRNKVQTQAIPGGLEPEAVALGRSYPPPPVAVAVSPAGRHLGKKP